MVTVTHAGQMCEMNLNNKCVPYRTVQNHLSDLYLSKRLVKTIEGRGSSFFFCFSKVAHNIFPIRPHETDPRVSLVSMPPPKVFTSISMAVSLLHALYIIPTAFMHA
jgi:hypothetical protein